MSEKIKIALLCGGQSVEHDISLISVGNILKALDPARYEISVIYISQQGQWYFVPSSDLVTKENLAVLLQQKKLDKVLLQPGAQHACLMVKETPLAIDVIFPVLHGRNGEDGSMQGLLALLNIAFVGPGILGSAICMDKDITKRLLREAGIKTANWLHFHQTEIDNIDPKHIVEQLGLPVFVKPVNAGSSIGIEKIKTQEAILPALKRAAAYDESVIVETTIVGREIETAVLGLNAQAKAASVGEIIPHHEFYTYEAKYFDPDGASLVVPADVAPEILKKMHEIAVKAFRVTRCDGMARVDFFLTKNNELYLNELNTIPGFTNISMYPKLWMAAGLDYSKLLDRLIELALIKHKNISSLKQAINL